MRTRQSVCARKITYRTNDQALDAARASGWVLRPYRCDRCRLFHLTSRTRGKRIPRPAPTPTPTPTPPKD